MWRTVYGASAVAIKLIASRASGTGAAADFSCRTQRRGGLVKLARRKAGKGRSVTPTSKTNNSTRRCIAAWLGLGAACLAAAGCATSETCDAGLAASPQFSVAGCRFRNMDNPQALPSQSGWKIWTRFLTLGKQGTVPVDPIPVRRLERAALDALDPAANHVIRLGHSSHLLKLRGKYWLIDPVFGERASPFSFAGPKRFHPPPLALTDLPPIEGLILSHDHYDHLDVPTIDYLRERVQRYFVPLGVAARLQQMGVAAGRVAEFDWWQSGRHGEVELTAAPAQHFSGRTLWDRDRTLCASWIIQSGSERSPSRR